MRVYAQQDPVLLRINNEEIARSEFEYAYNSAYDSPRVYDKRRIAEYLPRFVDDRLKIVEAKRLGLNATPRFRSEMAAYSKTLQTNSLLEESMQDVLLQDENVGKHLSEQFRVMQIYKYIPQNCSNDVLENVIRQMNLLNAEIKANPQADFASYVEAYSDDKRCFDVSRMEMSVEFEQIVFSMQKGDVSAPFFTPQGIHIVKLLDRKEAVSDDKQKEELRLRVQRRYRNGADTALLQKLKETYGYTPNQGGISELLALGDTDKVLFTLDGKPYMSSDFRYFAEANPKGIQRQFDDFVTKSLIDCENKQPITKHPEYDLLMAGYEDALLISEVTRQEVEDKARTDKAGLSAYFSVHKKDYRWERPRFESIVLHTRDKKIISKAKKLVKKKPFGEWEKTILEHFNSGPVQQVYIGQGNGTPASPYPYVAVLEKKMKGPEHYSEVLDVLTLDYEKFLEKRWMTRLRETYRVEINEEVLKTVNNH